MISKPLIDADTLAEWLDGPQPPRVLDARARLAQPEAGRDLWRRAHIPGALHADMDRDLAAAPCPGGARHPLPAQATFTDTLRAWGITAQRRVVVYDDMGGRLAAARAWWMLVWAGHPEVYVLDGGWQAWCAEGRATSAAAETVAGSDWQPRFDPDLIAGADDVARGDAVVLDARAGERYRGETEPMDARAGHIPGARSLPATALIDAEQRLVTDAALPDPAPGGSGSTIAYCGSGVTACLLILAHAAQGQPLPRLYPGSWSEWSADPARPIETGPDAGSAPR